MGEPTEGVAARRAAGNRRHAGARHMGVDTLTSILFSASVFLSLGLGALAAGTRAGRQLARRRGR